MESPLSAAARAEPGVRGRRVSGPVPKGRAGGYQDLSPVTRHQAPHTVQDA